MKRRKFSSSEVSDGTEASLVGRRNLMISTESLKPHDISQIDSAEFFSDLRSSYTERASLNIYVKLVLHKLIVLQSCESN